MAVALLLLPATLDAQRVPSPEDVLGHALGERFTDYHGVQRYSRALADASPLVDYLPYGRTPEGRELFQLVIARGEHLARLDAILAANAELTRPETPAARAREIARTNPAVVYFSYGVHGNESSSSEAALYTAWDLARGAVEVAGALDSLVVVIDPVANPDGRDRYVQWFRSVVGAEPNPNPQAREHHEPWPGGRFNHYYFDLNRDWAWGTQPETRARLATWERWNPQVHVDFHEMYYNTSYFFFPAAAPINPVYPAYVLEWGKRFGAGNARAFDARGWAYYTAESFDLFYPGYGDSWPSLTGAIGMTYEQAGHSMAGLAIEREDGDTLTLHERAQHHRVSGQATLRTAAAGKTALLLDYAAGQRAIGEDVPDVLLVPGPDRTRVAALVRHLRIQGIEVERAGAPFRAGAQAYPEFARRGQFPQGTYRVRMRQPRGRLAATLLQPETELDAEYSYDISAWSLPYAYGVEAHQVRSTPAAEWRKVFSVPAVPLADGVPEAGYGYLLRPGTAVAEGMVRFLRSGGRARVLARASTLGGEQWPAGSWFIPVRGNDSLRVRVERAQLGAFVVPVATGLAEAGIDLGSENAVQVRLPRVAVLAGPGVSATSFGAHWYFFDHSLGLPFDAIELPRLGRADLARYDVIVVPDAWELGEENQKLLDAWVRAGGRLIAVAGGAEEMAETFEVALREPAAAEEGDRAALLAGRRERERAEWREQVPGTILPARMDPAHPLTWGAGVAGSEEQLFVLHEGSRVFEPAQGLEAVAYFTARMVPVAGVISPAHVSRLKEGVWLATKRVGSGSVVLFADDPLFRMFWRTTHPLFANAVLLGPGM